MQNIVVSLPPSNRRASHPDRNVTISRTPSQRLRPLAESLAIRSPTILPTSDKRSQCRRARRRKFRNHAYPVCLRPHRAKRRPTKAGNRLRPDLLKKLSVLNRTINPYPNSSQTCLCAEFNIAIHYFPLLLILRWAQDFFLF
jgi:hypothetical protein